VSPYEYRQWAAQLRDQAEQLEAQARALRERAAELERNAGRAVPADPGRALAPPLRLGRTALIAEPNPPSLTTASPLFRGGAICCPASTGSARAVLCFAHA
jgi:hypothetical protein